MEAITTLNFVLLIVVAILILITRKEIKKESNINFEWEDLLEIEKRIISQINIGLDIQTKALKEIQDNYAEYHEQLDNLEIELSNIHSINSHFYDNQKKFIGTQDSMLSNQFTIIKNIENIQLNQRNLIEAFNGLTLQFKMIAEAEEKKKNSIVVKKSPTRKKKVAPKKNNPKN